MLHSRAVHPASTVKQLCDVLFFYVFASAALRARVTLAGVSRLASDSWLFAAAAA